MPIPSYGKVYAAGHRDIASLYDGEIVVQEKVDGSQFNFMVDSVTGQLMIASKGKDMTEHVESMFIKAAETVEKFKDALHPGWIYRCEFLNKPKHNTLVYERVPADYIILFDVETGPGYYLDMDELLLEGTRLGLECVPVFYRGSLEVLGGVQGLLPFLERTSVLGGEIEGIVIKNYAHFTSGGHALKGKLVREEFKERHTKDWKDRNPNRADIIQLIIEEYRVPARWEKSIQHLRERGELVEDPKDIGPLMREIVADFMAECKDEVAETLFKHFAKSICRGIGAGFPEYYKRRLAGLTGEEVA